MTSMTTLQEVALAVKRLQWRHHRQANAQLTQELGISLVQWDVLRHLKAQPSASLHQLAGMTFQTDQSMGELAKRMIRRGLLERADGPGRAVQHRLTPEGEKARLDGAAVFDEVLRESLGHLTSKELSALHALLLKATHTASDSV
jgi:DNA-binding MarR family transcriptional regulator